MRCSIARLFDRSQPKIGLPLLLGVAGGSGSGKSYFAMALAQRLGPALCEIVSQDSFYKDLSHQIALNEADVNFDDPCSLDFELLAERLMVLRSGQCAAIPEYDFCTHRRRAQTVMAQPRRLVIVDGILILHSDLVRPLFDETVYIDTPESLRFERRLERDVRERGRTSDGVHRQFFGQVKPMHDRYVEPSKSHADVVLSDERAAEMHLEVICRRVQGGMGHLAPATVVADAFQRVRSQFN